MRPRANRNKVKNCTLRLQRLPADNLRSPESHPLINISRGGLCFQSNRRYDLNETLELDISLNNKSILHAQGRICYRNPTTEHKYAIYGLSFIDHFVDADLLREMASPNIS